MLLTFRVAIDDGVADQNKGIGLIIGHSRRDLFPTPTPSLADENFLDRRRHPGGDGKVK